MFNVDLNQFGGQYCFFRQLFDYVTEQTCKFIFFPLNKNPCFSIAVYINKMLIKHSNCTFLVT